MVTECLLIGFVCLFVITFVCLLLEHFRAQKWEQQGDRLKSRMSELETIISAQGVEILEVQEELDAIKPKYGDAASELVFRGNQIRDLEADLKSLEGSRDQLLEKNAELAKALTAETNACRELEAKNKELNTEIDDLIERFRKIRKFINDPYSFPPLENITVNPFPQTSES